MRHKVVTLTDKNGQEVSLHCARVYESMNSYVPGSMGSRVVLELDRENQTERLWWYMEMADRFNAEYEFRQEDKCVILAVNQEIITAMFSY